MEKNIIKNGEKKFEAIFENAAVGIFIVDDKGYFHEANKAFCDMIEISEDNLKTMSCDMVSHPDDRKLHIEFFKDLASGKVDKYFLEKRFITGNGRIIWVRLTFSGIRDDETDEFLYSIAIVENITPQKEAEVELNTLLMGILESWDINSEDRRIDRKNLRESVSGLMQGF